MWYWWVSGYIVICCLIAYPMYQWCEDRRSEEYWSNEEFNFNLGLNTILWPGWFIVFLIAVGYSVLIKYPLTGIGKLLNCLFSRG